MIFGTNLNLSRSRLLMSFTLLGFTGVWTPEVCKSPGVSLFKDGVRRKTLFSNLSSATDRWGAGRGGNIHFFCGQGRRSREHQQNRRRRHRRLRGVTWSMRWCPRCKRGSPANSCCGLVALATRSASPTMIVQAVAWGSCLLLVQRFPHPDDKASSIQF